MTDELKGLELFLSSEKAVQGANTFRTAVESCAAAVERIGAVVDRLDQVLEHLGKTTKTVPEPLKKTGDEAESAGRKMKGGATGASDFDRKLVGLGGAARATATQMKLLVGSIGGFLTLRSAITAITDSEDKLRILQSVTGATAKEMQDLSVAANSLSINTRFSFGDATQTLINLTKAGASAKDAIVALPTVSNLARAGLLSLDQAGDTVIQTMAQFGLTIGDAARISDVLVKAADSTTSSVSSLADSLEKVGPVGREFGVSMETVTAAIAQMQQNGVQARIAGTGLQRIFQQLADPANGPEGAAQAIHDLNLSFDDIHPRNFTKALDNLGNAGLTLKDAIALVGTEFGYLLTAMVRNRAEIKSLDAALQAAGGDSAKKAAATVGTLGDSIGRLSNAAERFYREGGKAGLSKALNEIAVAGTDALNVLSGDAEAMKNAGTAGTVLASGVKVAGAAITGLVTFNALRRLSSFESAMYGAGKSVGALTALIRANPIASLAAVVVAAGTAFSVFGNRVSETSAKLEKFKSDAAEAEAVARQFDEIRLRMQVGGDSAAQARGIEEITAKLREQVVLIDRAQKDGGRVRADGLLGVLEQAAPETISKMREVMAEMLRLEKVGERIPETLNKEFNKLNSDVLAKFGFNLQDVRGKFESFGAGGRAALEGFDVSAKSASRAVGNELDRLTGKAGTAKDAIEQAAKTVQDLQRGGSARNGGAAPESRRVDLVQQLIRERAAELNLAAQSEEKQRRAKLLQEAQNAAIASGRQLRQEDLLALEAIARQQDVIATGRTDEKRAEAVRRIIDGLKDENALLQEQGAARDALQKRQEVLGALAEAKVDTTSEEYKEALLLLGIYEQLAIAEEKRNQATKGQGRRDTRKDDVLRSLEQEEQLLRLTGAERERYRRRIEAENELRQTGIEIGSREYEDYIKRRVALSELAEVQQTLGSLGAEFGASWGSALERLIIDMENGRDVARAFAQDLARLAFRQTVTNNLQSLLQTAGQGLANYFAGTPGAGSTGPSGSGFTNGMGDPYNLRGGIVPRLAGGVVPALDGQVFDQPSFLQRAGRMYSVAEGGKTTPEVVMRLQRDQRGNLGVSAVGAGGGGGPTNMVFPSVRNKQDARAVRATMGQRASEFLTVAKRKGRRGLRP